MMMILSNVDDIANDDDDDLDDSYDGNKQARTCAAPPSSVHSVCSPPFTLHRNIALGIATTTASLAHCCTIFLKSSGYRHRNPNINSREIIWLGNQLLHPSQGEVSRFEIVPEMFLFCFGLELPLLSKVNCRVLSSTSKAFVWLLLAGCDP